MANETPETSPTSTGVVRKVVKWELRGPNHRRGPLFDSEWDAVGEGLQKYERVATLGRADKVEAAYTRERPFR